MWQQNTSALRSRPTRVKSYVVLRAYRTRSAQDAVSVRKWWCQPGRQAWYRDARRSLELPGCARNQGHVDPGCPDFVSAGSRPEYSLTCLWTEIWRVWHTNTWTRLHAEPLHGSWLRRKRARLWAIVRGANWERQWRVWTAPFSTRTPRPSNPNPPDWLHLLRVYWPEEDQSDLHDAFVPQRAIIGDFLQTLSPTSHLRPIHG